MKNGIESGLRQGLGVRLVLGVLGMAILIGLASMQSLVRALRGMDKIMEGFHTDFVLKAIRADTVLSFLPVFAVLPFAASYLEDIKSKFARFFLVRSSYRVYLLSRLSVCFLCGGLVVAGGAVLAWAGAALVFIPKEFAAQEPPETYLELTKTISLLFLNGGLWAVVGMALSTLMESKYIAYASPFVLYYLLVILCERYFPDWFLLYPMEWVNPSKLWPLGYWGPAVLMMELTALFSMLFIWRAGRRLREL